MNDKIHATKKRNMFSYIGINTYHFIAIRQTKHRPIFDMTTYSASCVIFLLNEKSLHNRPLKVRPLSFRYFVIFGSGFTKLPANPKPP